jgi:hypothetical protein
LRGAGDFLGAGDLERALGLGVFFAAAAYVIFFGEEGLRAGDLDREAAGARFAGVRERPERVGMLRALAWGGRSSPPT